jgi:L-malate glycosyltransferase
MLVFIIPTWHPSIYKPNWCNWILPHIRITEQIADVVILQVNLEAEIHEKSEVTINKNHYYLPSPSKYTRFSRTVFGYGEILNKYTSDLETLYLDALNKYGKPDIIHAHVSMPAGYASSVIGKKYNIPVVVTAHFSGFLHDNMFPWRLSKYYKKMEGNIFGLYAVSGGFKDEIEKKTKLRINGVIPNPINVDLFKPSSEKIKGNTLRLVSTGNVSRRKGTDILLKAVLKLPKKIDWSLTIIGSPPLKSSGWESLDDSRIKLIKRLPQKDLAEIYSQSDIFIMSSRIETANVSMLEAMSCGCYVVCSNIPTSKSLLDTSVSSFFENENIEELKMNLMSFSDPIDREKQRKYVINNFSESQVKILLGRIYNSALFF